MFYSVIKTIPWKKKRTYQKYIDILYNIEKKVVVFYVVNMQMSL